MGRRATSFTTSGKCLNPTDQAQKEAWKRELKNKKRRLMVRAAVLKMKDPKQILRDMEKLDEMALNPVQQPEIPEKVLEDKGKKLRATFECILRHHEKENPATHRDLRKLKVEYEQKRAQLGQYFEAVKNAQCAEVENIPLPSTPYAASSTLTQDIPLPGAQPPSLLNKTSACGPPTLAAPTALPGVCPPHPGMMCPALMPPFGPVPPGFFPPPACLPNPGVSKVPPNLIQGFQADDPRASLVEKRLAGTISAMPKITHVRAKATQFVPTVLRVRRENKGATTAPYMKSESVVTLARAAPRFGPPGPVRTGCDAYAAFMKEMEGLL